MEEKVYTIGDVCEILNIEPHTLRYTEKALGLSIERDAFLNRVYRQNDIDNIKVILELKKQGLNSSAIKKVMEQQAEIIEVAMDTARHDIVIQDENINKLINTLTDKISTNVEKALSSRLEGLTNQVEELKSQNEELRRQLLGQQYSNLKEQEQHFRELDAKLEAWRQGQNNKGFFKRFFNL